MKPTTFVFAICALITVPAFAAPNIITEFKRVELSGLEDLEVGDIVSLPSGLRLDQRGTAGSVSTKPFSKRDENSPLKTCKISVVSKYEVDLSTTSGWKVSEAPLNGLVSTDGDTHIVLTNDTFLSDKGVRRNLVVSCSAYTPKTVLNDMGFGLPLVRGYPLERIKYNGPAMEKQDDEVSAI